MSPYAGVIQWVAPDFIRVRAIYLTRAVKSQERLPTVERKGWYVVLWERSSERSEATRMTLPNVRKSAGHSRVDGWAHFGYWYHGQLYRFSNASSRGDIFLTAEGPTVSGWVTSSHGLKW